MARIERDRERLDEQRAREAAAAKAAEAGGAGGARGAGGSGGASGAGAGGPAESTPQVRGGADSAAKARAAEPARDRFEAETKAEVEPKAPDATERELSKVPSATTAPEARTDGLEGDAHRARVDEHTSGLDRRRAETPQPGVSRDAPVAPETRPAVDRAPSGGAVRRPYQVVDDRGAPVAANDVDTRYSEAERDDLDAFDRGDATGKQTVDRFGGRDAVVDRVFGGEGPGKDPNDGRLLRAMYAGDLEAHRGQQARTEALRAEEDGLTRARVNDSPKVGLDRVDAHARANDLGETRRREVEGRLADRKAEAGKAEEAAATRALAAERRLDREGQPPLARSIRAIDEASRELEAGRYDAAAKIFASEGARARETAATLPDRTVARETLDVVGRNLEARAKLLGPSATPRELEDKSRALYAAGKRALWDAEVFSRDGPSEDAKVLEAVGRDSVTQAQLMFEQAKQGRANLGKTVNGAYRDIVNASFDQKIEGAGSINNFFTGNRDKLEADKKKMNEVFDELDRRMEKDGIEFAEAWHQMFDDHRISSAKDMPGFVTAGDAARFLRDHDVTKGLLQPMATLSDGLAEGDDKKLDAARGDLVRSLRDNGQWGLARSVLDGYKDDAKTAQGAARAKALEDSESGERWKAFGKQFVQEDLPVLVLSGVLTGGAGWGVKAATTAMKWGPRAVKTATVAGEIGTFVATERVLNDAINGRRADWSPQALAKDAALVGAGYAAFKAIGAGWRRFRAKNPKLGQPKVEVPAEVPAPVGGAASQVARAGLRKTLERADRATKAFDDLLAGPWAQTGSKRAGKLQERLAQFNDDVKVARDLLARKPTEAGRKAMDDVLAQSERLIADARAYRGLTPPAPIKGRAATTAELDALKVQRDAFKKSEQALRTKLGDDVTGAGQNLYRLQADLAGIRISKLDPSGSGFKVDPAAAARTHRATHGVAADANVGYAELALGRGTVRPLGPAASGSGPGSIANRSGRYAGEARVLPKQPGQHGFPRNNDSEVQLLEQAAKVLESNPNAKGVLRIFTENPPCPSCQRVMARFLRDHPNIRIDVVHGG